MRINGDDWEGHFIIEATLQLLLSCSNAVHNRTFLCSLSLITSEKKRKADDSKEMFKVRLKSYSEADLNTEQNILNTCNELSKHYFIFLLFLKIVSEVPEVRNHHFKHHKGNPLRFISVKLIEPFQLDCTNLIVLDRFHVCEQKVRFWP